jgi:hypothetical protein
MTYEEAVALGTRLAKKAEAVEKELGALVLRVIAEHKTHVPLFAKDIGMRKTYLTEAAMISNGLVRRYSTRRREKNAA